MKTVNAIKRYFKLAVMLRIVKICIIPINIMGSQTLRPYGMKTIKIVWTILINLHEVHDQFIRIHSINDRHRENKLNMT